MKFDRHYQIWAEARGRHEQAHVREALQEAITAVASAGPEEILWLAQALQDQSRRLFVAYLLRQAQTFPSPLCEPMLHAAVYELNPTVCRTFVEPCIQAFGQVVVIDSLLKTLRLGTDFEKAGAVNALHYTYSEKGASDMGVRGSGDHALEEAVNRRRILFMEMFVNNPDLDVRRSLISNLELEPLLYPANMKDTVAQALTIARSHTDEYIRHRVEVQLGRTRSLYPLPQRQLTAADAPPPPKKSFWKQFWR